MGAAPVAVASSGALRVETLPFGADQFLHVLSNVGSGPGTAGFGTAEIFDFGACALHDCLHPPFASTVRPERETARRLVRLHRQSRDPDSHRVVLGAEAVYPVWYRWTRSLPADVDATQLELSAATVLLNPACASPPKGGISGSAPSNPRRFSPLMASNPAPRSPGSRPELRSHAASATYRAGPTQPGSGPASGSGCSTRIAQQAAGSGCGRRRIASSGLRPDAPRGGRT